MEEELDVDGVPGSWGIGAEIDAVDKAFNDTDERLEKRRWSEGFLSLRVRKEGGDDDDWIVTPGVKWGIEGRFFIGVVGGLPAEGNCTTPNSETLGVDCPGVCISGMVADFTPAGGRCPYCEVLANSGR